MLVCPSVGLSVSPSLGLLDCRSVGLTAKIISGKSGIRIVFRKAFLPLQALKSYLQPPVVPGESQSVNQVLA